MSRFSIILLLAIMFVCPVMAQDTEKKERVLKGYVFFASADRQEDGTVTCEVGLPAVGARISTVTFEGKEYNAVAGVDGSFTIEGYPIGSYLLTVSNPRWRNQFVESTTEVWFANRGGSFACIYVRPMMNEFFPELENAIFEHGKQLIEQIYPELKQDAEGYYSLNGFGAAVARVGDIVYMDTRFEKPYLGPDAMDFTSPFKHKL